MKKHRYNEEEKQFITENLRLYNSYLEFCKVFNQRFGTNITREQLSDLCSKRMKFRIEKNITQYKPGHRKKSLPIGTIRKTNNGCTYIKVSDTMTNFSGYKEPDWVPLQKQIWETHNGKVPKGKMVCFLDCNRENYDIENLCCIDRKTSAILAKNKWWSKEKNLTLAAIKYAELIQIMKQEENHEN